MNEIIGTLWVFPLWPHAQYNQHKKDLIFFLPVLIHAQISSFPQEEEEQEDWLVKLSPHSTQESGSHTRCLADANIGESSNLWL